MNPVRSILPKKVVHRFWHYPLTWVLLCFAALLVIVASFALHQNQASRDLQQRLAILRSSGIPVDNATMELHFAANTSQEQTIAWNRVCNELVNSWIGVLGGDLLTGDSQPTFESILSGEQWQDVELVDDFLERLAPAMADLHALIDANRDAPIWQPIHFDGYATRLGPIQVPREVMRLVLLDCKFALYKRNKPRALRDLKTMRSIAEAFRWENFLVCETIYSAHTAMYRQAVQASLQIDLWSPDDLTEIFNQVGQSRDYAQSWPKTIASERAMALATLDGSASLESSGIYNEVIGYWMKITSRLPSVQRAYFLDMEQVASLPTGDLEQFLLRAQEFELSQKTGVMTEYLLPAVAMLAGGYVRNEDSRRLTRLALAVKHFRLSENRFPISLTEVIEKASAGITQQELLTVAQQQFGYSHDGTSATLWNVCKNINDPRSAISSTRPINYDPANQRGEDERGNEVFGEVFTIR